MRKTAAAVLSLGLLAPALHAAGWSSSDELRRHAASDAGSVFRASADRVIGKAEVCAQGACREAFDGKPVREGDTVKTGVGGRLDLVVESGGRLRVLEGTELKVGAAPGKCGFKVLRGAVLAALESSDCQVESTQAAASTKDSRFRLDFNDGGVARFVVSDSAAKLIAKAKPRALLKRWWAGKSPTKVAVPMDAAGAIARASGVSLRGGEAVREGAAINAGDELATPMGGWATVALAEGFAAVLDQGSRVLFEKKEGRLALSLLKGRVYISRLRPGAAPPIVTAGASQALEGSDEFEVSVDENSGLADFAVYAGQLAVSAGRGQSR